MTRPGEAGAAHLICGLATTRAPGLPRLLPPGQDLADLVLAVADGTPRNPLTRQRRPLRAVADLPRLLFGHKLGLVFLGLFGVLVAGFVLLATAGGDSPANALYLTFLDAAGAAVTNSRLSAPEKAAQFMLAFDGMAFLPVVTAAVVGARPTGSLRSKERPLSGHVIVAGLGNVGTRIAGQLHDLGVDVVCVDRDENAAGIRLARQLGLRVVIGETAREEDPADGGYPHQPGARLGDQQQRHRANLETALHARALAADVRLVLRLSDDDLAGRVQEEDRRQRDLPERALPGGPPRSRPPCWSTRCCAPSRSAGTVLLVADRGRQGQGLRAGRAAGGECAPSRGGTRHRRAAHRRRPGQLVTAARLPDRPAGPHLRSGYPHRAERGAGAKPKRRRSRASVSKNLGSPPSTNPALRSGQIFRVVLLSYLLKRKKVPDGPFYPGFLSPFRGHPLRPTRRARQPAQ